jgi:hypothetical protein
VSFDPEDIERMSPAIRAEIQDHILRSYFARRRRHLYAEANKPAPRGNGWPRVWYANDTTEAYMRGVRKQAVATIATPASEPRGTEGIG